MNLHSCKYGSGMKDINIKSLEKSEYCNDLTDSAFPYTRDISDDSRYLKKYMKISYSCLGKLQVFVIELNKTTPSLPYPSLPPSPPLNGSSVSKTLPPG